MTDVRGGLVRFTRLRRNYTGDGVYGLVPDGDYWAPERSYTLSPASHVQPDATTIDFSVLTSLTSRETVEVEEPPADVLERQESGLEQTRPTTEVSSV